MLIIRNSQMDQFAAAADQRFADQALDFLRRALGDKVAAFTNDEVKAQALDGLRRCRAYGIQRAPATLQFITLMLLISPEFDQPLEVSRFLSAPGLDPDFKVELLTQMLARHLQAVEG
jgi:hypothetical protein